MSDPDVRVAQKEHAVLGSRSAPSARDDSGGSRPACLADDACHPMPGKGRLPPGYGAESEYRSWYNMVRRCHDKADEHYADYGGRGIRVCRRRKRSFRSFLADMGRKPEGKPTLGRIDNERGYEPGNCRWESWFEQQNNRRSSVRVTVDDVTLTLAQWAERSGITRQLIQTRKNDGWALEVAVSTPAGVRKAEAHERAGIAPAGAWTPRPRKRADGSYR